MLTKKNVYRNIAPFSKKGNIFFYIPFTYVSAQKIQFIKKYLLSGIALKQTINEHYSV